MEKLKILVVDDESRMRKLVRDFLVKQNFDVLEAGDGEEAVDIFFKESIHEFIRDFTARNGIVVMATHDASEIALCDRIYYMEEGRTEEIADTGNVLEKIKKGRNKHE